MIISISIKFQLEAAILDLCILLLVSRALTLPCNVINCSPSFVVFVFMILVVKSKFIICLPFFSKIFLVHFGIKCRSFFVLTKRRNNSHRVPVFKDIMTIKIFEALKEEGGACTQST